MDPALLEQKVEVPLSCLTCENCKGFLTSSPIFSTLNGKFLCSDCPDVFEGVVGMSQLEEALKNCNFPCKYKSEGCEELIVFGAVKKHEKMCNFRTISCPVLTVLNKNCDWQGQMGKLWKHYVDEHPEFISKEVIKLNLELENDSVHLQLVLLQGIALMFWCKYETVEKTLSYAATPLMNINSGTFRLQLFNSLEPELSINLKQHAFEAFWLDGNVFQNMIVLNMLHHLAVLNDPNVIIIKADINLNLVNSTLPAAVDVMKTLKCHKCKHLMFPPIFKNGNNSICKSCRNDFSDRDIALEKLCVGLAYPCRQAGCGFVGNFANIEDHLNKCTVLKTVCLIPACKVKNFFNDASLIHHYTDKHNFTILKNGTTCINGTLLPFSSNNNFNYCFFENIYNEQIVIQYQNIVPFMYCWTIFYRGNNLSFYVRFEHDSCTRKSDKYLFTNTGLHQYKFTIHSNNGLEFCNENEKIPIFQDKCCIVSKFCITYKKCVSNI